jgi:hypothetical protein
MTIGRKASFLGVVSLLAISMWSIPAQAACSGSGTTWSCAAGASDSNVQDAVNSASDGAVITFAAGSYTWSSWLQFSMTKGVTLICATPPSGLGAATINPCVINSSGTVLGINGFSGTSTKLYRISGFTFSTSNTGQAIIWYDACNPGCRGQISQLRIDHNTFNITGTGNVAFFGDQQSYGYYYGVIDHNMVNASAPNTLYFWIGAEDPTPPASPLGTANNLFVEDNTVNITTMTNNSVPCMSDAWGGAAMVMRHNTVYNCSVPVHGIDHNGGPQNWEVYNNTFVLNSGTPSSLGIDDGYRMVHHQGSGEGMYFNNTFTPKTEPHSGDMLSVNANYVDTVCSGLHYPCSHQAGRDFAGNLMPIYAWNNVDTVNGSGVDANSDSSNTFVAPNRDYYTAVSTSANTSPTSPFDGTAGVGFGTVANRPTTCTHSNATYPTRSPQDDGHGGVGYFATDVGPRGTLYTCTATNTWSAYYVPYTYPHPLVSGAPVSGGTPPSPPQNLTGTVH